MSTPRTIDVATSASWDGNKGDAIALLRFGGERDWVVYGLSRAQVLKLMRDMLVSLDETVGDA